LTLTIKGTKMANYQLNAGDSVVDTISDTDNVTGAAVAVDAGSVTAVLSSTTDTVVVDPSGTFATITAGTTVGVGNTVTVNATVGGVASAPFVGTYDVVAAVVVPDATTLSGTFGTESGPTGTGLNPPLTAAQTAALVAAGVPYTSAPLTAAQTAALVAAGIPWVAATAPAPTSPPFPAPVATVPTVGTAVGQTNPVTGVLNT